MWLQILIKIKNIKSPRRSISKKLTPRKSPTPRSPMSIKSKSFKRTSPRKSPMSVKYKLFKHLSPRRSPISAKSKLKHVSHRKSGSVSRELSPYSSSPTPPPLPPPLPPRSPLTHTELMASNVPLPSSSYTPPFVLAYSPEKARQYYPYAWPNPSPLPPHHLAPHLPTQPQPLTPHLPTQPQPLTPHLPTQPQPLTPHLPTQPQPLTPHLPTQPQPLTPHLPTQPQPLLHHLPSQSQPQPYRHHQKKPLAISPSVVKQCNNISTSRKNFAVNLVRKMFSTQERMTSNCAGKKGKDALDPTRLELVKKHVFSEWPLKPGSDGRKEWKDCIQAIDEAGRRLNR